MKKVLIGASTTLLVPGTMALLSIPVCLIFKEYQSITGFVIMSIISFSIGFPCYFRYNLKNYHIFDMLTIITISWLAVTLVGTVPFLYVGHIYKNVLGSPDDLVRFTSFINAIFESVSGFTSTGFTMVVNEESLNHSLQWWRSFMQWIV